MLVHVVFFWLKDGLSDSDKESFFKGLETLKEISCKGPVITGTPASTPERPVIDSSYDFGLTCVFESIEEHNTYQAHEIHQKFIADCAKYWDKVQVYDYD